MKPEMISSITAHLKGYSVVVAYVFGSYARGSASALSDLDIAVFLAPDLSKSERFDARLRLSGELSAITGREVDVIVMNDAPLSLSYEIIKGGMTVLCGDKDAKAEIELDILSRYLDRRYYDKRRAQHLLGQVKTRGFA